MLFIILGIVGVIAGFIIGYLGDYYRDLANGFLGACIGTLAGLAVALLLSVVIDVGSDKQEYIASRHSLYALQDNSGVSGSFFLGSGFINGDMVYTYLVKETRGLTMKSTNVDKVHIQESDNGKPSIVIYNKEYTNSFVRLLVGRNTIDSSDEAVVTIPKGSVKFNYNVDLK